MVEAVAIVTIKEEFFPTTRLGGGGKEAERRN
jgi:hypothetical protein